MAPRSFVLAWLVTIVVVTLAACGRSATLDLDTPNAVADAGTSDAAIALALTPVDFGSVACGTALEQTATLTNPGTSARRFTVSATPSELFELVGPESGEVSGVGAASIRVRARAGATAPGVAARGVLRVTPLDGARVVEVPLTFVPEGAWLVLPSAVDFGTAPFASPTRKLPLRIENRGTAPVSLALQVEGRGFAAPESMTVAPGGADAQPIAFQPEGSEALTGTLTLTTDDPVCGTLAPISLRGEATGGALGASPGALDFGDTDCGAHADEQPVRFTNYGTTPVTAVVELERGALSPYVLVHFTNGVIGPGETVQTIVRANTVPPSFASLADTVLVRFGAEALRVPIGQRPRGHAIQLAPTLDLGRVAFANPAVTKVLDVYNAGNVATTVTLTATPVSDVGLGAPVTVLPGATAKVAVSATPTRFMPLEIAVAASATGAACAAPTTSKVTMTPYARASWVRGGDPFLFAGLEEVNRVAEFVYGGPGTEWVLGESIVGRSPVPATGAFGYCLSGPDAGVTCGAVSRAVLPYSALQGASLVGGAASEYYYGLVGTDLWVQSESGARVFATNVAKFAIDTNYSAPGAGCALRTNGTVGCWGPLAKNLNVGLGSATSLVDIPGPTDGTNIAVSLYRVCITRPTDKIRCLTPSGPFEVTIPNVAEFASFSGRICARQTSGAVKCFVDSSAIVDIPGLVAKELARDRLPAALTTDGRVVRWYGTNPPVLQYVPGLD